MIQRPTQGRHKILSPRHRLNATWNILYVGSPSFCRISAACYLQEPMIFLLSIDTIEFLFQFCLIFVEGLSFIIF